VATRDMGRKERGCCAPFTGELGPRLTQCGLGRGLLPYKVASSSIQPFGHNRHEPKTGAVPLLGGGSCNTIKHNIAWAEVYLRTKWHLDASSRLATIGMGQNWMGTVPFFWGSWVPIEHKVAWAEAYLHTKWHLSRSSQRSEWR